MDKSLHWIPKRLLSYTDCHILIVCGARGLGKTYGFKKVFIEYYCPKHLNLIFNLLNSYESKNIECLNNQISALVSLEKSKEIQEKVINLEKIYKKSKKF